MGLQRTKHAKTVLISGIGIAGPTLAFWLRARGFRPTLVERSPALRSGGYVIDFWGSGYDVAERMGLLSDIDRLGYKVREMRVVDDGEECLAGFGSSVFDALAGTRLATIGRYDLSQLIFDRIKDTTEVIFGDELVGAEEKPDCIEVQLKYGGERRFDLVVGADGINSNVRRLIFGPQSLFEKQLGYYVAAFESSGYRPRDTNAYVFYGRPGLMIRRFALHGERTLFLLVFCKDDKNCELPADRLAQNALLRESLRGLAWECPQIAAELERAPELYLDRVSQVRMDRWSKGRVVLIGDAACCVSLTSAQGAGLAMTTAYALARELAISDGRYQVAYPRFETLLKDYVRSKQRAAEWLGAGLTPKTGLGLYLRNQAIKAAAIPGFARLMLGKFSADTFSLGNH